jgi:hypothetical protein
MATRPSKRKSDIVIPLFVDDQRLDQRLLDEQTYVWECGGA